MAAAISAGRIGTLVLILKLAQLGPRETLSVESIEGGARATRKPSAVKSKGLEESSANRPP